MGNNEWGALDKYTATDWLWAVGTAVAAENNPEELIIWIPQTGGGNYAALPEDGRRVVIHQTAFAWSPYVLAHEIGHAFGLRHTWIADVRPDPATGVAQSLWDMWDLVYKPGYRLLSVNVPHTFFESRAEAAAYPVSQLEIINTRINKVTNCEPDTSNGSLTCKIKGCTATGCKTETHSTGSPALKGLAYSYPTGPMGTNLMSYDDVIGFPRSLNDSQIRKVRKYLRWSQKAASTTIKPGQTVFSSNLPLLGGGNIRQVAEQMDFDGDGLRDIGIWEPPMVPGVKGTFKILLSTKNYSQASGQFMSVSLGKLGDIPLVADFDGDGVWDVGVFQPGGGSNYNNPTLTQGYWRWCQTNAANPVASNCTTSYTIAFGSRGDVPIAGLRFDSTTMGYLTMFTPATGQWSWTKANGSGPPYVVTLGNSRSIPLPGLYDGDFMSDIAVYSPDTATFKLLRSQLNWSGVITRSFGSSFIPQKSGTSLQRAGAVPLSGMTRPYQVCMPIGNPVYCRYEPRRVFSLFYPHNGAGSTATWNTMWDSINSSTIDTCTYGNGALDIPIPGIRLNADLYSDMVVYRAEGNPLPGYFHYKNSTPSVPNSCTGTGQSVTSTNASRPRVRVFAVSDMTGDGKPELMRVYPETMTIEWLTSESDFHTYQSRSNVGTHHAIVL